MVRILKEELAMLSRHQLGQAVMKLDDKCVEKDKRIADLEDMVSRSDKFAGATLVYQLQQKEAEIERLLTELKAIQLFFEPVRSAVRKLGETIDAKRK